MKKGKAVKKKIITPRIIDMVIVSKANLNIKLIREAKEIPQKDLTATLGLNCAKYESGKKDMTLTTLSKFSKALDTQPHMLLM